MHTVHIVGTIVAAIVDDPINACKGKPAERRGRKASGLRDKFLIDTSRVPAGSPGNQYCQRQSSRRFLHITLNSGANMSKIRTKTAAESNDASYTKTIAAIAAILLLLMAAFWLFGQTYRYQMGTGASMSTGAGAGAGATATATKGNNKDVPASDAHPKFVDLGTFTAHTSSENGEQIVQTSLSLKLTQPGLEARAKASLPEIQHHVNMVLQSKSSSELAARENREKLAQQVKQHVEYVMGFRRASPVIGSAWVDAMPAVRDNGVAAVLFTSFVIQR